MELLVVVGDCQTAQTLPRWRPEIQTELQPVVFQRHLLLLLWLLRLEYQRDYSEYCWTEHQTPGRLLQRVVVAAIQTDWNYRRRRQSRQTLPTPCYYGRCNTTSSIDSCKENGATLRREKNEMWRCQTERDQSKSVQRFGFV